MEMRKRIRPELIDITGEPRTSLESVVGPRTAHLDKQFERVIRPIQKEYIQNQSDLYEEEHVLLDGIIEVTLKYRTKFSSCRRSM